MFLMIKLVDYYSNLLNMKKCKLRNDLLEKVLIHAQELNSQKLLNDIKPGGSFFVFMSDFNFANENEIQFTDQETSTFRSLILDYINQQTLQLYRSKIDLQNINFELDENSINQFLSKMSDQIDDNGIEIETCLTDFIYHRLILIYFFFSDVDTIIRITKSKFSSWLNDRLEKKKPIQNDNTIDSEIDTKQKLLLEQLHAVKIKTNEIDYYPQPSYPCALKLKTDVLIQEFKEILIVFFDSIDKEIECTSSKDYVSFVENTDVFIAFLLLEDLDKEIDYYADTSVFSKFLLSIEKFYEKNSLRYMINMNKFTSHKTRNFLKVENYIKNQSRSKKNNKYKQAFLDLDQQLRVLQTKIPNF